LSRRLAGTVGQRADRHWLGCLQAILPLTWISVSVDDLLDALPPSLMDSSSGIGLGQRGKVTIGDGFREIEAAWMTGGAAQERIRSHLDGLGVLWAESLDCARAIAACVVLRPRKGPLLAQKPIVLKN
jgi:hypothetical protein